MHPVMRTMFVSLAIGSMGVLGSMFYYIGIAEATRPILDPEPVTTSVTTVDDGEGGVFSDLVNDLRRQEGLPMQLSPTPPREYLRRQVEAKGYDVDLFNRIVFCESKWRMVPNKQSTAFGYFQILDGTEKLTPQYRAGLRKTDPYVNIDMAISLYEKYGTIPWTESQGCWDR